MISLLSQRFDGLTEEMDNHLVGIGTRHFADCQSVFDERITATAVEAISLQEVGQCTGHR
jgi:hypothetical protein